MRPVPPPRWSKRESSLPFLVWSSQAFMGCAVRRFEAKSYGSCPGEAGRGTVTGRRYALSSDGTLTRVKVTSAVLVHDPETRRALQLDTLAASCPWSGGTGWSSF
jgi:hypothetical protein